MLVGYGLSKSQPPRMPHQEGLDGAPARGAVSEGLETPGVTLIRVRPDSVEYWDSPNSKVVRLLGMARAAITCDPDKFPGENESFDVSS